MRRAKRIALAAAGLLGLATPAIAGALSAPAWLITACAITMIAGAACLAAALPYSRWSKKPKLEKPKLGKPKEDKKEEIPLTTTNLETLMPGTAELSKEDREEINTIVREAHDLMAWNLGNRTDRAEPPKKEMRKRILGYRKIPVSVPTPMEDLGTVPLSVFQYRGKNDPEKIKESLKELEVAFGPSCPSSTFPHDPYKPRKAARSLFGNRIAAKTPPELAASFRDLASRTSDEEARQTLLRLAEEADGLPEKEEITPWCSPDVAKAAAERHREKARTADSLHSARIHIELAEEYEAQLKEAK